MIAEAPCNTCQWQSKDVADKGTCRAFPAGIPEMILRGENDHRQPVAGDGGIVWKAR